MYQQSYGMLVAGTLLSILPVILLLACLVSARCGAFYAESALESATVVTFAYPGNGPAFGKSRTSAGDALLQRLRLQSA